VEPRVRTDLTGLDGARQTRLRLRAQRQSRYNACCNQRFHE
jgi:hypothetical protein